MMVRRPWAHDLVQAIPGGHARHAHHAEVGRQGNAAVSTLRSTAPSDTPISAQPSMPTTMSPTANFGLPGGDDFAGGAADHRLAERLRRGVAFGFAHAPAHVRIERQVVVADQHLALDQAGMATLSSGNSPAQLAARTRSEHDALNVPIVRPPITPPSTARSGR
jgi:hypothetical protein